MPDIYQESLEFHKKNKGKLFVQSKAKIDSRHVLSMAYTPGVAEPCREIAKDKEKIYDYTFKQNTVAVVTDGTAVLGLGNIGPEAALPVMEGKAVLFKEFGNVDAFPICFTGIKSVDDFVDKVRSIAPVFGGINLEDISAPRCFEIEEKLQDLGIPVFHDDQHGTAIVTLAALINGCKVTGKHLSELKIVINGAGSAGIAIAKILKENHVKDIILCDSKGIISKKRNDLNKYKQEALSYTNFGDFHGQLADALKGSDVFIGVSVANVVTKEMVRSMNENAMVFAMANPVPEIMPDDAKEAGASIVATGRSDFPNQINNVLAFPGIFRGALDAKAKRITKEMKLAASHALADYVKNPAADNIIPDVLDKKVSIAVAEAVKKAV